MWMTLIFAGTAALFVAMTIALLQQLRWVRRLPALDTFVAATEGLFENVGQDSSLTVDGASVLRHPGGRMPPEPADKMSAPHFQKHSEGRVRCSVVIAARDEEARIEQTVRHLLAQTGVELDIIVVDDRSADRTGEILRFLAKADERLQVKRVDVLPDGWLGKCHACHVGASAATGDWILFTDADCWLKSDVLARALAVAEQRRN